MTQVPMVCHDQVVQHSRQFHLIIFIFGLLAAFGFGVYAEELGLKAAAFFGLFMALYGILLVPLKMALVVVFVYIGFEGFLKVVSGYHPVVHVGADVMVIALCVKLLVGNWIRGGQLIEMPPFSKLIGIHFIWLGIVFFNPYSLSFISSLAGSKIYISMVLLYFFGYNIVSSKKDVRLFLFTFLAVAFVHGAFGLYQGVVGPESVLRIHPLYAVQLAKYEGLAFRPFGLTNLPGGAVIFLYPVMPFLLYFVFSTRSWWKKALLLVTLPFLLNLFLISQIRSAILKGLVGSLAFFLNSIQVVSKNAMVASRRLLLSALGVVTLLVFFLPYFLDYSVQVQADNEQAIERSLSLFDYNKVKSARSGTLDRFLMYVQEVPFGAGFARVGAAAGAFKTSYEADPFFSYKYFFADNFWLASLIEIGIPGTIILTLILICILWQGFKMYRQVESPSINLLQLAILSSLLSICIGLYAAEGILYNPEASFFWFFSGILMKLPSLEEKSLKSDLN